MSDQATLIERKLNINSGGVTGTVIGTHSDNNDGSTEFYHCSNRHDNGLETTLFFQIRELVLTGNKIVK